MKNRADEKKSSQRGFAVNIVAVDETGNPLGTEAGNGMPSGYEPSPNTALESNKVSSSKPLPDDSKMQLKLLFPESKELNLIKANGTIKWVKQIRTGRDKLFVVGVHFKDISTGEKRKITDLWKNHREK